jgi:hypothetical protein
MVINMYASKFESRFLLQLEINAIVDGKISAYTVMQTV